MVKRTVVWFMLTAGAVFGAAALAHQDVSKMTFSKHFGSADLGNIDLLGVCGYDDGTIHCWNADGEPDKNLTERLEEQYAKRAKLRKGRLAKEDWVDGNAGPDAPPPIVPGRQNRFIVLHLTPDRDDVISIDKVIWKGQKVYREDHMGPDLSDLWYAIHPMPGEKYSSVSLEKHLMGRFNYLHVQKGAEASYGPITLHLDRISEPYITSTPITPGGATKAHKAWDLAITLNGRLPNFQVALAPIPMANRSDQMGFGYADESGNPVTYEAGSQLKLPRAGCRIRRGEGTRHQVITMNVNPAKIGDLAIRIFEKYTIKLTDIPLDPK